MPFRHHSPPLDSLPPWPLGVRRRARERHPRSMPIPSAGRYYTRHTTSTSTILCRECRPSISEIGYLIKEIRLIDGPAPRSWVKEWIKGKRRDFHVRREIHETGPRAHARSVLDGADSCRGKRTRTRDRPVTRLVRASASRTRDRPFRFSCAASRGRDHLPPGCEHR